MMGYENNSQDVLFGGMNFDFSTSPPRIYPQKKKIDFGFYCGVCSDSTGNLAFYTNGISIRDTTHNIMLHGDTINPGPIWLNWQYYSFPNGPFCFALPAPGPASHYYFFHMSGVVLPSIGPVTSPFYYTVIDMNANDGLGAVTAKNQVILPAGGDYTTPVAVKHGNGRDWWVITGEVSTPYIYTFLLDPYGVHGPFETEMAFDFPGEEFQSLNAMSPDGCTYVRCDGNNGLHIYNFDRCSGTFGDLRVLPFADPEFFGRSTVFAPDSRHLYVASTRYVTVLDLYAADIAATHDTLAYFDGQASPNQPFTTGFFHPGLAPDGKIYYATTNGTLSLHVIHSPNLPGQSADLQQHGIDLPKFNNGTMCQFPNYRLGRLVGSPCDTLGYSGPGGGGFEHLAYEPPAVSQRSAGGYTLLPPIGKPSGKPRARQPSMMEMALEQLEKQRKEREELEKQELKNQSKN
ncbi:MAG: hypothetical protein JNJ90_10875 [Saprospiraceae bacterium]|jgi:hypothetical protein|nr:hypothetical protein [Saprospiraceae bacterium]